MITLRVNGNDYKADKFIKGTDYIKGYTKGQEVIAFTNIKDFKNFKLLYGAVFEKPPMTEFEKFQKEQAKRDMEMTTLLSELMMMLTMKGLK